MYNVHGDIIPNPTPVEANSIMTAFLSGDLNTFMALKSPWTNVAYGSDGIGASWDEKYSAATSLSDSVVSPV
jgi:hypothetical protein